MLSWNLENAEERGKEYTRLEIPSREKRNLVGSRAGG